MRRVSETTEAMVYNQYTLEKKTLLRPASHIITVGHTDVVRQTSTEHMKEHIKSKASMRT